MDLQVVAAASVAMLGYRRTRQWYDTMVAADGDELSFDLSSIYISPKFHNS